MRYSPRNLKSPSEQRRLLRPVYWLGNWQFACLDYYRPPKGIENRCVRAEDFPPVMKRWIQRIEIISRKMFHGLDMPKHWAMNTCLVNLYGDSLVNGKRVDTARVGEHRDFEPGPVASISLGERALFQFVGPSRRGERAPLLLQQWLDDRSLLIFGGERWKNRSFHRVLRVDRRAKHRFKLQTENFETRRINFTFRYVPEEHVQEFSKLAPTAREDVRNYMQELAKHSEFFAKQLVQEKR